MIDGTVDISGVASYVGLEEGSKVLVVSTKSGFLRVIPVSTPEISIVRMRMALNGFPEIGRYVFEEMKKRKLELVHSTGFCPISEECVYEGYFLSTQRNEIEEFSKWLESLDSMLSVEVTHLQGR
ncbi:MAG: hypothetical protein JSW61_12760 [Candidatus Thorarchaeota archaeon]|nr:MAG: hypothetical protein JSW61_12760 [Candidatus Thorarchaeota archaeon]